MLTLSDYLGDEAAEEVRRCGSERGWTARVPARPWHAKGRTAATLALLNLVETTRVRKVIVKIAPPVAGPQARERLTNPYAAAARDCPPAFEAHLVGEAEPPWPTRSGGAVTFQKLAGDDVLAARSLDQLPYPGLLDATRLIVRALLLGWNVGGPYHNTGPFGDEPPTYAEYLRQAVGGPLSTRGSIYRYADERGLSGERARSIRFPDAVVCPNPLYLATAQSPLHRPRLDVLTGRSHGDLHLRNVLVPDIGGVRPAVDRFQLVDLDTYHPHRCLAADPVFLLLSGIAEWLPRLPAHRWDALRETMLHPARTVTAEPPFGLPGGVYATTTQAIQGLGKGLTGDWTTQYRLATLAGALAFTAFTDLGPRRRAWFFRLAAECGRILLDALKEPTSDDAVSLRNPFGGDDPEPVRITAPTTSTTGVDCTVTRIWSGPVGSADMDGLFRQAYRQAREAVDAGIVLATVRQLYEDAVRLLGASAPISLYLLHNVGYWTYRTGDLDGAARLYEQAWLGRHRALGPEHPDTEESYRSARDGRLRR
jgi:hypothetical protein